ncbi:MAG: Flp family type IVb pilin [Novosphingobium sp.]
MQNFLTSFVRDEAGASAAEYALILAVVAVGIGSAAYSLGNNIKVAINGASSKVALCNTGSC